MQRWSEGPTSASPSPSSPSSDTRGTERLHGRESRAVVAFDLVASAEGAIQRASETIAARLATTRRRIDMAPSDSDSSRHNRDQLRQLVERDYARAESAEDAWEVLGVVRGASQEEVTARYEEYDQLYRADNLEKLDDNDLTRKALELRKMISRAIVEIQTQQDQGHHEEFGGQDESTGVVASIDPDSLAMADIYFRDGLGWLKLQDYESAVDCFQRSLDHDPSQGVTLAYHTYAQFKRDPENPSVVEDCRDSFETAVSMEPDDVEIRILQARFGLETQQFAVARNAIERAESLKPNHSEVRELRRLYDDLAN